MYQNSHRHTHFLFISGGFSRWSIFGVEVLDNDQLGMVVEIIPSKVASGADDSTEAQRKALYAFLASMVGTDKKKYAPWG
jgi:hypothetical protein